MKLWDKGFSTDKKIDLFTVGNDRELDLILAKYDVIGNIAHAKMLHKIGLLTDAEIADLETELKNILHIIEEGNFIIEDSFEDVHSKIEFLLTEKLGERWFVQNTSIKFWPCCRWIHYPLTAFAELLREHRLSAAEIESVDLSSFPMIPYPCFSNQDPANLVAATFSFPHAAAMVALDVPAGPEWFAPAQMNGGRAKAFRKKVQLGIDPAGYDPNAWGVEEGVLKVPSRARIKARGTEFERASLFALGDPWHGAPRYGDGDLSDKFRRQARTLAPLSERWHRQVETIIEQTLNLEQTNVREFVRGIQVLGFD